jgi:hypothetical protein
VLTDFGCEHSFAKAAESVQEHYGFEIGVSAVRSVTLKHAQRAQEQLEKGYAQSFRILPKVGASHVIAEADGTMICTVEAGKRKGKRPRDWKELKLVAAQAKDSLTTFYGATFARVEGVGCRLGHCARKAGWGLNSQIHAVGDGAEWVRLQSAEVFGTQGTFLCDFFHVSEYLAAAAEASQGNKADRWRRTQQRRLKRGAIEKVIETLETLLGAGGDPRRGGTRAQCAPLFDQSNGLPGLPQGHRVGSAHRIRHDRVRTPPRASGQAQKSWHRLAAGPRRSNRTSARPQSQPRMGFFMELTSPSFNHTPV